MKYSEEYKDLFTVSDDYCLAHCIASDLAMGAGIAVPMQKKFHLRNALKYFEYKGASLQHPTCIKVDRVFNLITKKKSSGKPTLNSLKKSLDIMKEMIIAQDIKKLAMPKIGCGLDRLQWGEVREYLQTIFADVDVEVIVCVWK